MKMRNSFARSISCLEHFLSLQKKKRKKKTDDCSIFVWERGKSLTKKFVSSFSCSSFLLSPKTYKTKGCLALLSQSSALPGSLLGRRRTSCSPLQERKKTKMLNTKVFTTSHNTGSQYFKVFWKLAAGDKCCEKKKKKKKKKKEYSAFSFFFQNFVWF